MLTDGRNKASKQKRSVTGCLCKICSYQKGEGVEWKTASPIREELDSGIDDQWSMVDQYRSC